ncbi:MAG TPA: phosphoribosylglycinamide formyltransferase [Armatimonadota bacterium]
MMHDGDKKIGVLASGGGSNMQAVMDAIDRGQIRGRIVLVISDNPQAYALERARLAGSEQRVMLPRDYPSREAYSQALAEALQSAGVELLLLAGFMRIITRELIEPFRGRMMNIHPALIPSFCGPGFYGHHVHEAVLNYGAKVSGCTVHFVEEAVDGGPIILQRVVPVLEDDTPDTLAARVLIEEHLAYPEAVRLFCADRLRIEGRLVRILPEGR